MQFIIRNNKIKKMLSYIGHKPLKVIQKFHYYRIVYKFSPSRVIENISHHMLTIKTACNSNE